MKVLFLSQGKTIEDHPGWHDALEKLQAEGFISSFKNIPYFGYAEKHGWDAFYNEVYRLCKEENFDLVYFHHFHGGNRIKQSPQKCIENIFQLNKRPIVITSVGDLFSYNWMTPHYPEYFKDASRLADITFSTQMGKAADKMINWGAKNVVLSPLGMCQVRFKSYKRILNEESKFDLVFVGSKKNIIRINPISKSWWTSIKRTKIVKELHNHFKDRFGLYGYNWNLEYSLGPIQFDMQQKIYRQSKFAIDAPAIYCSDYYSSNRHLFQIASGTPTIMFETPRIKNLYRANDHCYYISDKDHLIDRIEEILKIDTDELLYRANNAAKYIEENHTQYHRMKFKIDTVKRYIANGNKLNVKFPFFLPEVDLKEEMKYAIREAKK